MTILASLHLLRFALSHRHLETVLSNLNHKNLQTRVSLVLALNENYYGFNSENWYRRIITEYEAHKLYINYMGTPFQTLVMPWNVVAQSPYISSMWEMLWPLHKDAVVDFTVFDEGFYLPVETVKRLTDILIEKPHLCDTTVIYSSSHDAIGHYHLSSLLPPPESFPTKKGIEELLMTDEGVCKALDALNADKVIKDIHKPMWKAVLLQLLLTAHSISTLDTAHARESLTTCHLASLNLLTSDEYFLLPPYLVKTLYKELSASGLFLARPTRQQRRRLDLISKRWPGMPTIHGDASHAVAQYAASLPAGGYFDDKFNSGTSMESLLVLFAQNDYVYGKFFDPILFKPMIIYFEKVSEIKVKVKTYLEVLECLFCYIVEASGLFEVRSPVTAILQDPRMVALQRIYRLIYVYSNLAPREDLYDKLARRVAATPNLAMKDIFPQSDLSRFFTSREVAMANLHSQRLQREHRMRRAAITITIFYWILAMFIFSFL